MSRLTMGCAAEIEPLVATIAIRRNTGEHALNCCYGEPHRPGDLLVLVRGKWMGAASCSDPEHLADVIRQAIEQAGVKLDG